MGAGHYPEAQLASAMRTPCAEHTTTSMTWADQHDIPRCGWTDPDASTLQKQFDGAPCRAFGNIVRSCLPRPPLPKDGGVELQSPGLKQILVALLHSVVGPLPGRCLAAVDDDDKALTNLQSHWHKHLQE